MFCSFNCLKWKNNECDESSFCPRRYKLNYLYDQALLTEKQREHIDLYLDKDGTDKEAFITLKNIESNIKEFVKEGKSLYIHSLNTGNSKTSWAIRILQAHLNSIWPTTDLECRGLFIYVPRLMISMKDALSEENAYYNHIKKNVLDVDLGVFDEIGTKSITTFESENLLNIISTRIDNGKSNIYTSNLPPEELREKLGDRLYSRIVNLSTDIEFFGQDKRIIFK